MKTLYLHIGQPKTATSSVQVFLGRNVSALNEHGFGFPSLPFKYPTNRSRREKNAHFLIEAARNKDELNDPNTTLMDHIDMGLNMIHEEFEKYDTILLTDEGLWRSIHYGKKKPMDILLRDAAEYNYTIKILVYLRRQDDFLVSRWNQYIKEGSSHRTFKSHIDRVFANENLAIDYAQALDSFSKMVGKENMIVRRFEPSAWKGGSIYEDFMDALGLSDIFPLMTPIEDDVNLKLDGNSVEIQRMINANTFFKQKDRTNYRRYVRELSSEMGGRYKYSMFTPKENKKFLAHFADSNQRVVKEYIGDGKPLFSDKIKELPKWKTDNEYIVEDFRYFMSMMSDEERDYFVSAMILNQQYQIDKLSEDYKKLSEGLNHNSNSIRRFKYALRHPFRTLLKKVKKS